MSTMTFVPPVTSDQLLGLPDDVGLELVQGKLVERHMGLESSEIAARIIFLITLYLRDRPLGRLFGPDASFRCFPWAPDDVRRPDVSLILRERLVGNVLPAGHCPIAPDLAVEVISPSDIAYELEDKIADYLRAGVLVVWVVHPPSRSVRIHRPRSAAQGPVSELTGEDVITGEQVLPGFSCRVSEFFPLVPTR